MEFQKNQPKDIEQQKQDQQQVVQGLTFEQIKALIVAAIAEGKKPDPEVAEKLAKEKAALQKRREEMVRLAQVEEQSKQNRQDACSHRKPNDKPSVGGQIHSDGLYHPICLRCQKEFNPFAPTQDMIAQGV